MGILWSSAEFDAMKVGVEMLRAIWYELRMMGIPISWPSYIYEDNMLDIHNTSKPESTLKKKCNAIDYYAIHESMTVRESLTEHIRSEDNPAELLTKAVTGQKRKHFCN